MDVPSREEAYADYQALRSGSSSNDDVTQAYTDEQKKSVLDIKKLMPNLDNKEIAEQLDLPLTTVIAILQG